MHSRVTQASDLQNIAHPHRSLEVAQLIWCDTVAHDEVAHNSVREGSRTSEVKLTMSVTLIFTGTVGRNSLRPVLASPSRTRGSPGP